MPTWLIYLIQFMGGALVTLFIQFVSLKEANRKISEERKLDYARRREPLYAKALEHIFAIEGAGSSEESVRKVVLNYKEWLISNAFFFPPGARKVLFKLQGSLACYYVDVGHEPLDKETVKIYRQSIDEAKDFFLDFRDISWFPKELSDAPPKKRYEKAKTETGDKEE